MDSMAVVQASKYALPSLYPLPDANHLVPLVETTVQLAILVWSPI